MITQNAPDTGEIQDPLQIKLHSEKLQSNYFFDVLNAYCKEWSNKPLQQNC
jgi:hypothetical protein